MWNPPEDEYDENGDKIGDRREKRDWLGREYTEHRDADGRRIAEGREKKDWLGREYTEYRDADGGKSGEGREKKDWLGREYTEYRDETGATKGRSYQHTDLFGRTSTRYSGETPLTRHDTSVAESAVASGSFGPSEGSVFRTRRSGIQGQGCLQKVLIALVFALLIICNLPTFRMLFAVVTRNVPAALEPTAVAATPPPPREVPVLTAPIAPTTAAHSVGARAMITTEGGTRARLRQAPGMAAEAFVGLPNGAEVTIIGGPEQADDLIWWQVQSSVGEGWIAETVLRRQP